MGSEFDGQQLRFSGSGVAIALAGAGLGLVALVLTVQRGVTGWPIAVTFGVLIAVGEMVQFTVDSNRNRAPIATSAALGYALLVWLINAFVVLPLLGDGIAGTRLLTVLGMVCFAGAHTVFFVVLAYIYAGLVVRTAPRHAPA